VKNKVRLGLGSFLVAGAVGAMVLPATSAWATEGFVCPVGTDTIEVPFAWSADNVPSLAGTVCVDAGTTFLNTVDVNKPWRATVKSTGASSKGLDIRFKNPKTGDKIELIYAKGRTVIK
jgi:hypothetical protein